MNQFQRYFLDEFVEDFRDGMTEAEIAGAQAAPAASVLNQANAVTVSPDDSEIRVAMVEFPPPMPGPAPWPGSANSSPPPRSTQ